MGDVSTPCCGYDTAKDMRLSWWERLRRFWRGDPSSRSVICWNPYNGVVQCHACGQMYLPIDDRVLLELLFVATDEQLAEAYDRAGESMPEAADRTKKAILDAVKLVEDAAEAVDPPEDA